MSKEKKSKPSFSPEFKEAAVAKCRELGINQTSIELGVSPSALRNWCSKANTEVAAKDKPSYQDLEKENLRLKKELGYVSEINKILKKSTAIFSSNEMGGLR